jgi:hypothetical protein
MFGKIAFLALGILFAASYAASSCDTAYNSCISSCCSNCGSTLSYDGNGDLVCDVGTKTSPNTACMQACLPCSSAYQSCTASTGGSMPPDGPIGDSQPACCGSLIMIGGAFSGAMWFSRRQ